MQNTFIDVISVCGISATGTGGGSLKTSCFIDGTLTQAGTSWNLVTSAVSGAGTNVRAQWTFPNGGLQVRNTNGGISFLLDALPASSFTTVDVVVGYHHS
jgi:hypothetical protein